MFVLFHIMFRLYKERLSQVDVKLQEVMAGCAQEYLEPLANLQENMQIRTKVAGGLFHFAVSSDKATSNYLEPDRCAAAGTRLKSF